MHDHQTQKEICDVTVKLGVSCDCYTKSAFQGR